MMLEKALSAYVMSSYALYFNLLCISFVFYSSFQNKGLNTPTLGV